MPKNSVFLPQETRPAVSELAGDPDGWKQRKNIVPSVPLVPNRPKDIGAEKPRKTGLPRSFGKSKFPIKLEPQSRFVRPKHELEALDPVNCYKSVFRSPGGGGGGKVDFRKIAKPIYAAKGVEPPI
jgi:hypothetical protein